MVVIVNELMGLLARPPAIVVVVVGVVGVALLLHFSIRPYGFIIVLATISSILLWAIISSTIPFTWAFIQPSVQHTIASESISDSH